MGVFYQEELPNSSKKCKFLKSTLKDAFSSCRSCRQVSTSSPEEEKPTSDFDDEQEVIVSTIRSRAMERSRQRSFVLTDNFSWMFSPRTGEVFLAPKIAREKDYNDDEKEEIEIEEFVSVGSCFSCCSSGFISVETNLSRCSSFSEVLELQDFSRLSIFQQLCHCEGWPFGLCRKGVLLPPLPKSPSESWSWRKGTRSVKMPRVLHTSFDTALHNGVS
ncbi:uncharacterized protein [Euphorbia lathyris]|uniref:uncharacterized protein n=1 Tax=Euphorbia lathyris TaxID=212925 RepID=UPI003313D5EB